MADNRGPTPGSTNTSPVTQTPVTEVFGTPGDGKVVQWNATTQRLEWGASSGASSGLTPTAVKTTAYTAVAGDLAMMNVAAGATALTLPTAPADKAQVGYRAIGATASVPLKIVAGGSDAIGLSGVASTSIVLADETVTLQYQASGTRWIAVSNVKTQASLDARYTSGRGLNGGLPMVASRQALATATLPTFTSGQSTRAAHTALAKCTDIRFLYAGADPAETDLTNSVLLRASLEIPVNTTIRTALSTGAAITSLPVVALTSVVPAGMSVEVRSGTNSQVFTTTAAALIGTSSVSIASATPTFAFPIGSTVTFAVTYQATFNGRTTGVLDPGASLLSDPISITLAAGQQFFSRALVRPAFGASSTLAAASSAGATTLSANGAPPAEMTFPQLISVDSGGNAEVVTITGVSGTGPYTYTISPAATKAHASGVYFGQANFGNQQLFTDLGDRWATGSGDNTAANFIAIPAAATTTLSASASAGDTKVTLAAAIPVAAVNPTITIDTGGTPETVGVASMGASNTYYLSAALTGSHASGATCTGGVATGGGTVPTAILAEYVDTSLPKPALIIGDSIAAGNGNIGRASLSSFLTMALEGVRPFLTGAKVGETAQAYSSDAFSRRRRHLINIVGAGGWAIHEYGINDNPTNVATLQAWVQQIIADLKFRGLKVALTTNTPNTTSTDGWTTTTNQTLARATLNETARLAYNAWVRAGAGGLADAVIDMAAKVDAGLVAGGAENGLWAVGAGGVPYTWDGLHPTNLGHQVMSTAVTAVLPSMT